MMSATRFMFGAMLMCLAACSQEQTDPLDSRIEGGVEPAWSVRDTMPAPAPIGVVFGSSFGMCAGYCWSEFTLHEWGIVGVRKSGPLENAEKPDQTIWARITSNRMGVVLAAIDTMAVGEANETMGCPDCADGGSCWIKIERPGKVKHLNFDCMHGAGRWQELREMLGALTPAPHEGHDILPMPGLPQWR